MKSAVVMMVVLIAASPAFAKRRAPPPEPTRFTVTVTGSGPDVVLIPGLGSSREVYAAEAKLLAGSYRLHLVQINGFAGQPAGPNATGPLLAPIVGELHAYITDNHLHPAVIGHSLGGLLGLMLADAHPDDVSRLVIVDSLPFYGLLFDANATVDSVRAKGVALRDGMIAETAEQFAAQLPTMVPGMVKNPDGIKAVTAASLASDRAVFANAMFEDLTTDLRAHLATIKTRALLLYPYDATTEGNDPAPIVALYTGAYHAMPNVALKRIDDARHFLMYDQPAAFHAAVLAFLTAK